MDYLVPVSSELVASEGLRDYPYHITFMRECPTNWMRNSSITQRLARCITNLHHRRRVAWIFQVFNSAITRCLKLRMVSRTAAISSMYSAASRFLSSWTTIWVLPTRAFGPRSLWS